MPALRVVASRQAEGGEEKIEYGGGGAQMRCLGRSTRSTRRKMRVAGRAGMRAHAFVMRDRVVVLAARALRDLTRSKRGKRHLGKIM
jgi:hypothetical protein